MFTRGGFVGSCAEAWVVAGGRPGDTTGALAAVREYGSTQGSGSEWAKAAGH